MIITTSKQGKISTAKVDAKGNKITVSKRVKTWQEYEVIEREIKTDMVTVDNPSRLYCKKKGYELAVQSKGREWKQNKSSK